jgi:hypothetical protein
VQALRRPVTGSGGSLAARHFPLDSELRRRIEPIAPRKAPPRRIAVTRTPKPRASAMPGFLEQNLLAISAVLLLVGVSGWGLALYHEFRDSGLIGGDANSVYAETTPPNTFIAKSDPVAMSSYRPTVSERWPRVAKNVVASAGGDSAASIVARDWSYFEPKRTAEAAREQPAKKSAALAPVRTAAAAVEKPAPAPQPAAPAAAPAPQVLASASPFLPAPSPPRLPLANIEAKTTLVDFATAPFPYHGEVPGSGRAFLDAGKPDARGHVNFRGRMFLESKTFGDDRVLLHIPAGFDPSRPAVMVVFFHGHGATLERDVRDRQRLPDQISAAGLNAVLVAPQFAFDAADSSAGKFWEPNGFKRFLDESAKRLASLYGDQRSASAFATMPIVLVSYSGGFGPTLSVLARGGAQERIRGLVLLDSLYAGIDQFADWIADHRQTFFVSSYTPHTAHHNADLRQALAERSVPYGSELRRNHLQGMVTFLPAGDVSHRDFVTHAWTDNPVADILLRMTDTVPSIDRAVLTARRN